MKLRRLSLFLWLIAGLLGYTARAQQPADTLISFDAGKPMSVGLVLSGGGAKGIAHIGVIRALEEHNIPIDYIAGTSMGAIVGGLYACGYTPGEMLELLLSRDFSYWSTGTIDPDRVYYFSKEAPMPTLYDFDVNLHPKDSVLNARDAVPASLINPLPMNFAFMDLFAKYSAQCNGDFNRLMVPFRCVASDVEAGHKVVHSSGSLGDAIRTSMSFPLVFQPIRMNGALLYDGGLYDNFPVDVMTEDFAPDIMLGVDVSASAQGPQTSYIDQVDNLVTRHQNYDVPADLGIKLRINLDRFSLLDFPAAREIEKIGYDHAMAMMDSIERRVTSRISYEARNTARGVFKSKTPEVIFDRVFVKGGTEKQNKYIKYLFEPAHADTFDIEHARESFYRAITPGRLKDLFPKADYNDTTEMFSLHLHAYPKDKLSVGVGGYLTSSTNSYIFLNAAWRTLTFSSLNLKINGWIGQSYMAAMFNGTVNLRTAIPSSIGVYGVVSRQRFYETDHLFYQVKTPSFINNYEYYARLEYAWAISSIGKMTASLGYGHQNQNFFRTNAEINYETERDRVMVNPAQIRLAYNANTLNQNSYPTQGHEYMFAAMGVMGKYKYYSGLEDTDCNEKADRRWIQIESRTRNYWDLSRRFAFGVESDVLYSTRSLFKNYNMSIVTAPSYNPTPATYNSFSADYRANSFVGVGLVPIYKYNSSLTARLHLNCFIPFRQIKDDNNSQSYYGRWFANPQLFSELDINYALPFANLTLYGGYATGRGNPWTIGLSFGIYILANKYLR